MLQFKPISWLSWNFRVSEGDQHVADIGMAWWIDRGKITMQDVAYDVRRAGLSSGTFSFELGNEVLAQTRKPNILIRAFEVDYLGTCYTLRAKAPLARTFVLMDGQTILGSVSPASMFTRNGIADLPDDWPLPIRVFIVWLVVIMWKRQSNSASAGM